MRGRREERIEAAADHAAAVVFGAAVLFSTFMLPSGTWSGPSLAILAGSAAIVSYLLAAAVLRSVKAAAPTFEISPFRISDLELAGADELLLTEQVELLLTEQAELVLTEADRLCALAAPAGELVLDDILAEIGPGSRVVRLFDPAAMPTPGQLNARIERHLREDHSPTAPPDASQALHEALAELRRSLR